MRCKGKRFRTGEDELGRQMCGESRQRAFTVKASGGAEQKRRMTTVMKGRGGGTGT